LERQCFKSAWGSRKAGVGREPGRGRARGNIPALDALVVGPCITPTTSFLRQGNTPSLLGDHSSTSLPQNRNKQTGRDRSKANPSTSLFARKGSTLPSFNGACKRSALPLNCFCTFFVLSLATVKECSGWLVASQRRRVRATLVSSRPCHACATLVPPCRT